MQKHWAGLGKAAFFGLKTILLACSADAWAQNTSAPTSADVPYRPFGVSVSYDYQAAGSLRFFSFGSVADPTSASATLTGMRVYGAFHYRPALGVDIALMVGSMFASQLTLTGNSVQYGSITQVFDLDSATMYGGQIRADIFPKLRFHITPSLIWRSAYLAGTGGALTNGGGTVGSACSYDYSTNGASTCFTLGLNSGGGVATSRFFNTYFAAAVEMSVDIGADPASPWLILSVGADQGIGTLSGATVFTPPGGTAATENVTFSTVKTEHVFAGLASTFDNILIKLNAQFIGDLVLGTQVQMSF